MGNYWKDKADRMFGSMPADVLVTAARAVVELREDVIDKSQAREYLNDIRNCLDEYPTRGMSKLGLTEEELADWKKKYEK